jgi:hypothetical protein
MSPFSLTTQADFLSSDVHLQASGTQRLVDDSETEAESEIDPGQELVRDFILFMISPYKY